MVLTEGKTKGGMCPKKQSNSKKPIAPPPSPTITIKRTVPIHEIQCKIIIKN